MCQSRYEQALVDRDAALADQSKMLADHEELSVEHEGLCVEHEGLCVENELVLSERDNLVVERDNMESDKWDIMKQLREAEDRYVNSYFDILLGKRWVSTYLTLPYTCHVT